MQDALTNYFSTTTPPPRQLSTGPDESGPLSSFVWKGSAVAYETTPQPLQQTVHAAASAARESFDTILQALQASSGLTLSDEQRAICHFAYRDGGNLVVDSVAGSGKTTTLLQCLWFLEPRMCVLLLSFNKSVQRVLQQKVTDTATQVQRWLNRPMAHCEVRTSHAHGYAALRRHFPNAAAASGDGGDEGNIRDNKMRAVEQAYNEEPQAVRAQLKGWKFHMVALLKLLMNLAVECDPNVPWTHAIVCNAARKYGVPMPQVKQSPATKKERAQNEAFQPYMRVLYRAHQMCCQRQSHFDYDDMSYLPVRLGVPLQQYDVVCVDEAQDLAAIQIELVARSLTIPHGGGGGGRVILVGDANQALYGFRGCMTEAMDVARQRFQATLLPLHICWRCPVQVIRCAQNIVPHIRARPGAPEGVACSPEQHELMYCLRNRDPGAGHLVLCRTNAPLVELAIDLQRESIPCCIQASSVHESLKRLLRQVMDASWGKMGYEKNLLVRIDLYREWKRNAIKEGGQEGIEKHDQLDVLHTIIKSLDRSRRGSRVTPEHVLTRMAEIFIPPGSPCPPDAIQLMTVHQAKGMEVDCVYVTRTDLLPHPSAKDCEWQLEQESNARYVAVTRAKRELYYFV